MLVRHGLQHKILSFTADNASNNVTQSEKLGSLPNSFDSVNQIRCFNHTMQLSAKALLKPFGTNRRGDDNEEADDVGGSGGAELPSDDEADDGESDGEADNENGLDPFEGLDEDMQEELMLNTEEVTEALQKVSFSSSTPVITLRPKHRSASLLLPSSTRRLSHFLHGRRPAAAMICLNDSSLAM